MDPIWAQGATVTMRVYAIRCASSRQRGFVAYSFHCDFVWAMSGVEEFDLMFEGGVFLR